MKDQMNIHNDKGFEDIEQLLQPQCDFHASSQTKQQVIEKARKSLVSHRTLRIFPWICAACVAGIICYLFYQHLIKGSSNQKKIFKALPTTLQENHVGRFIKKHMNNKL